jgi:hypothetical protein
MGQEGQAVQQAPSRGCPACFTAAATARTADASLRLAPDFRRSNIMKTIHSSARAARILGVAALLSASVAAATGQGWDAFNAGDGERIVSPAYVGTALQSYGQGWDAFNAGDGEKLGSQPYMGTSLSAPSGDSDVFHAGIK